MGQLREIKFSESTDGQPVNIVAVASPGTPIHTSTPDTGDNGYDKLYVYAVNNGAVARVLTLEIGGTGPGNLAKTQLQPNVGVVLCLPGTQLNNAGVLAGFLDGGAGEVNVLGWVARAAALGFPAWQDRTED
ncbi:MAG TPA: hypothetical protein VM487_21080 [Phycisphaerae bacterium]|nr:hypothetical protein [Phycisphaerae bacterium]